MSINAQRVGNDPAFKDGVVWRLDQGLQVEGYVNGPTDFFGEKGDVTYNAVLTSYINNGWTEETYAFPYRIDAVEGDEVTGEVVDWLELPGSRRSSGPAHDEVIRDFLDSTESD